MFQTKTTTGKAIGFGPALRSLISALPLLAATLTTGPAMAQQQAASSDLPGGASSLQETYDDWRVACAVQTAQDGTKTKRCAVSQEQADANSKQRVLAIEMRYTDKTLQATFVMPFGLLLDKGISLKVDDNAVGSMLPFHTCLPGGCIVITPIADKSAAALRSGTTLFINAVAENGQPLQVKASLKGLAAGLDRISALMK
jgi:invasion protein IalB